MGKPLLCKVIPKPGEVAAGLAGVDVVELLATLHLLRHIRGL
jgi:hypothetical protein